MVPMMQKDPNNADSGHGDAQPWALLRLVQHYTACPHYKLE